MRFMCLLGTLFSMSAHAAPPPGPRAAVNTMHLAWGACVTEGCRVWVFDKPELTDNPNWSPCSRVAQTACKPM